MFENFKLILPKLRLNFFENLTQGKLMTFGISIILVVVIILAIITALDTFNEFKKQEKLFGKAKNGKLKNDFIKQMKIFKVYHNNLKIYLTEKDKEGLIDTAFYSSIVMLAFLVIYFISVRQILMAIILPIVLIKAMNKITSLLITNVTEKIEEQLPFAIDNIIRISSKYGDLKSIIYESSKTVDYPLRNALEHVSRRMISGNSERVLMDFAKEYDNVWIYSLVFTLISYVQDANKTDTIKNLKHLRNILEKENTLKKSNVTDKRYGVVINYALAVFAGLGGIGNIMFNPAGKDFFFGSFVGIVCFSIGYGCILLTLIINITMSKMSKSKASK